ncbi:CAP domain-containing protein [Nonomuraea fuscirosea]|uniref:CAP domain-containing protein n=1 Tax=Nonomuraea fuscirosea TaxID=1291556 RepID=UPI002DDB1411|nr:CAP domain-containing protein [Nonomuraea fuscirosea]WSA53266.1 CAP domain-containing protein [Nonomuraea fuscirosea]
MRRQLQAIACLGSLAALSIPSPAAASSDRNTQQIARQDTQQACRVLALKPFVSKGRVRGTVARTGCADQARLRVRIKVSAAGPDRVVKSGSKVIGNGRITANVRCGSTPRRYYMVALDSQGRTNTSRAPALACGRAASNSRSSGFASAAETAVVTLTNQARARNGCRPLTHDAKLHRAAERHSADMARNNYFSHESRDGRTFDRRIKAEGFAFRLAGENIAKGQPSAATVVRAWLDSPGHRANIMNCSFTHIGVGHAGQGPTWTQDFAAR